MRRLFRHSQQMYAVQEMGFEIRGIWRAGPWYVVGAAGFRGHAPSPTRPCCSVGNQATESGPCPRRSIVHPGARPQIQMPSSMRKLLSSDMI